MDSENYFSSRYLTIVGHVQSGKTYEEINYCFASVKRGFPVFFITRNITADQLQLNARFIEFNKTLKKPLDVFLLSHNDIASIAKRMESPCVIILLCNQFQLKKVKEVLYIYKGEYNVCIDEVDFAIKTKYGTSELDTILNQLKEGANHILVATATPIAVFTTQKEMGKIIKIKPTNNYHGVNSLNIEMIESSITSDPSTDNESINKIYSSLLDKYSAVLLHTVTKKKKNHESLMEYISELFPTFTYIIYNGDGIQVMCKGRNDTPFTRPKSINQYGQFINKYYFDNDIHHFYNYSIAEVLQILVDDYYQHTHISIFAGQLASRGVSFVSTDYSLHLTDQYFHAGKLTHGENYLQSLRILGCYKDNPILTLWCSEHSWKLILDHNKIINSLVEGVEGTTKWLQKIKKVIINKPETPLSRPKIVSKLRKISKSHFFSLDISSDEEEI
jgi:hypothetical protein